MTLKIPSNINTIHAAPTSSFIFIYKTSIIGDSLFVLSMFLETRTQELRLR
ncbi:uncharacterized protein DS421_1g11420 [Arachis hypogaea]|nr:uncharacterized protein DS421_1g11420 [Arachis hypogaea]